MQFVVQGGKFTAVKLRSLPIYGLTPKPDPLVASTTTSTDREDARLFARTGAQEGTDFAIWALPLFIAFMCEAAAVFALLHTISRPIWFILLSGLCFFAWGEIFSLFPSITGDLFGKKWATTNYGIVYTSKGLASIFAGPVAAMASVKTGSWIQVFYVMVGCDVLAALLARFWLKPVAKSTFFKAQDLQRQEEAAESAAAARAGKDRPLQGTPQWRLAEAGARKSRAKTRKSAARAYAKGSSRKRTRPAFVHYRASAAQMPAVIPTARDRCFKNPIDDHLRPRLGRCVAPLSKALVHS